MKDIQNPQIQDVCREREELKEISRRLNLPESISPADIREADDALEKRLECRRPMDNISGRLEGHSAGEMKESYDLKRDLEAVNPNYELGAQWQENCQRCVPAYELRRRGYDVTALPRISGEETDESSLPVSPFRVWKNPEIISCSGDGLEDIRENMEKWGDGARAEISVVWNKTNSGHVFVAEQVNGETRFYDPQNGSADVSDYFKMVEPGSVQLCRIDNLDVTDRIKECCKVRC